MGKKMLRVLCCGALICVVAGVSFAAENQYQKSVLKSKSVDYIKKLNEVYHPAEIYDKKCVKLSTSDNEQISHMMDKLLNNIDKKSSYYKMTKDDIKEIIDNEMKMSPDKRVKSTKVECVRQVASKVGKNKANVNRILELIAGALKKKQQTPSVYHVVGSSGRTLDVYEEKCVITTKASLSSWATGNSSDGEKTIYYVDCIGVQFKRCGTGLTIGYLQLETASGLMNKKADNFWNENSFTFNKEEQNEQVAEIADYIKEKIDEIKRQKSAPQATTVVQQASAADELKKFKELLDMGVITQEEFDAKKKQLLGL